MFREARRSGQRLWQLDGEEAQQKWGELQELRRILVLKRVFQHVAWLGDWNPVAVSWVLLVSRRALMPVLFFFGGVRKRY